jgi:hypothetical protein
MDDSAWSDAWADLAALTARWSPAARAGLARRFVAWAETGVPLPAALMLALGEMLDD